jgi:hypothetical protein
MKPIHSNFKVNLGFKFFFKLIEAACKLIFFHKSVNDDHIKKGCH